MVAIQTSGVRGQCERDLARLLPEGSSDLHADQVALWEEPTCQDRPRPAAKASPGMCAVESDALPWRDIGPDGCTCRTVAPARQCESDAEGGVPEVGRHISGPNAASPATTVSLTEIPPNPDHALTREIIGAKGTQDLPLHQAVPVQIQCARLPAWHKTRRAMSRTNLRNRRRRVHPGLDVERRSDDPGGASCFDHSIRSTTEGTLPPSFIALPSPSSWPTLHRCSVS